MKKSVVVLVLALAIALPSSAAIRVGLTAGYAKAFKSEHGSGLAYGLNVGYDLSSRIAVGLRLTRFELGITESPDGLSKGKTTLMPIEIEVQGRFPVGAKLTPYVAVGGGYAVNSHKMDGGLSSQWSTVGFSVSESVKSGFSILGGAGLDFAVTPKILANFEVRIMMSKSDGSWTMKDVATGTQASGTLSGLSWNSVIAGLSVKYVF